MVMFLSYPKSGRTWIRFMLNDYLGRRQRCDLPNVFAVEDHLEGAYPFEWTHLTAAMLLDLPYYRMGAIDLDRYAGKRCILLVRHFYPTMASAYRQAVHRIGRWTGSPAAFIRSPVYGVVKLVTMLNIWEQIAPALADRLVISYEGTREDPGATLRQCLQFAGVPVEDDIAEASLRAGSFEAMREASLSEAYRGTCLAPADVGDPNSFKVRTGGTSDWEELFDAADLAYIDRVAEDLLVNPDAPYLEGCRGREAAHTAGDRHVAAIGEG